MNSEEEKCVIVLDEGLPPGTAANTAAILGITMGMKLPDVVGSDVPDADGNVHMGIIQFPVPILKAGPERLRSLREKLFTPQFADLTAVDFSSLAQGCKSYTEYIQKMAACPESELNYTGIAICGNKKKISKLTGNMPLLR